MTINQISVFLENSRGKLTELLALLERGGIRILAATVADTTQFGILRMIVSDSRKALRLLQEHNVNVSLTEVLAIAAEPATKSHAEHTAGGPVTHPAAAGFAPILSRFTGEGLGIEYMYCFSTGEMSVVILRPDDRDKALDVVRKHNLPCITEAGLTEL